MTLQAATLSGGVVTPDYTLGATPAGQSVAAGDSALYGDDSGAHGFADSVTFAVSGLPASVTADFSPTTVVGSGSSTLTLSTTSGTGGGELPVDGDGDEREPEPHGEYHADGDRASRLYGERDASKSECGSGRGRSLVRWCRGGGWVAARCSR